MTYVDLARRFAGKVVIIIGGASGIGAATAMRIAAEGGIVVVADVAGTEAQRTASRIVENGGTAVARSCDIANEVQVADLFRFAATEYGGIDGVHVNAADLSQVPKDSNAVTVPLDVFDRTIEVNLRGHLLCTRSAVPALLERGGGSIVYTSSRGGLMPEPVRVSYGISKSGLHALMRHTALTWGREGVRANVVAPGTVLTAPLLALGQAYVEERKRLTPSPRLGEPCDIAAAVAFLLSEDAGFINGQILSVDGGVTMR